MNLLTWTLATLSLLATPAATTLHHNHHTFTQQAIDSGQALKTLSSIALLNSLTKLSGTCKPSNIKIRREWRTLSTAHRQKFIKALQCLASTPSTLLPSTTPGWSPSLYTSLVIAHARQARTIHNTGNFLLWHRYFLHAFSSALTLCNWHDGLPYWEWPLDLPDPSTSPLFDGSPSSLGTNGHFIPDRPPAVIGGGSEPGSLPFTIIPPGTGGGCVVSGPMSSWQVHVGPWPLENTSEPIDILPPYEHNPACLKRDLNGEGAAKWLSYRNITELILGHEDIRGFQGELDLMPGSGLNFSVHGAAHVILGGSAGNVYTSPSDPAFFLTHAGLDRVYWVWQMLDLEGRSDVAFTNEWRMIRPGANTSVDDLVEVEPHLPPVKLKDLMNTVAGTPFCYVYA